MQGELLVLRLIHVVGGVFWAGALIFMSFFLIPAFAESGPAAGAVMAGLERRKIFTVLPTVAVLTILAGLRLLMILSGGFSGAFFLTWKGHSYLVAAIASVLALTIGLMISRPAMLQAGRLVAQRESAAPEARAAIDAQAAALRLRGAKAMRVVTLLVLLAAVLMSVTRYL